MYIIYTTCPDVGSKNVGDKLIEVRTRELIKEIKGVNNGKTKRIRNLC